MNQSSLCTRQKTWAQATRRVRGRAYVLQPALVLPKAIRQGSQGVVLAEELIQALQPCELVRQLRQGHAAHIQNLELLQCADVAGDHLDEIVAAMNTCLSTEGLCLVLLLRVRPCLAPVPRPYRSRPASSDHAVCWCKRILYP